MPPTLGRTRIRRAVTLLSAIALSTLSLVTVLPDTTSRADDTTTAAATSAPRTVEVKASGNHDTNKAKAKKARTNVATTKVNKSTRAAYYTFPAITPASGESVGSVTLLLKVTSAAKAKKGHLVVRPVTSGWKNGVVSYRTRPHVGPVVGTAKIKRGTARITLKASAVASYVASGLTLRITRSSSKAIVKLAGTPSLRTTLVTSVTQPAGAGVPAASTEPTPAPVVAAADGGMTDKPVFAHYFPPYPISLDNQPGSSDYYATQYLRASGEGGKFASTGGLLRDRPLPRAPITSGDYQLADMRTEVDQAIKAGLDGFAVDILTTSNTDRNWTLIGKLMTAAKERGFKIMLQPDMTALTGISTSTFAQAMATLAGSDSVYRTSSNAVVISPFYAEAKPASWYADALAQLKSKYGVDAVLLPLFLDATSMASYASISIGFANWGVRDVAGANSSPNWAAKAHALGKQWMEPVAVQDERPRDAVYQEAWNTETLRATWNRAISQNADAVLLTTWNDYSECTSFAPSTDHGTAFLDISRYFESKFKTGAYPVPAKDAVFIVHRIQKYSTLPTSYSNVMKLRYSSGSAPRDKVEIVTILTGSSQVTVNIGGQNHTYTAPAGFNAQLFDLATGTFTATVVASGTSVTTKDAVSYSTEQQDLSYHAVSSNDGP